MTKQETEQFSYLAERIVNHSGLISTLEQMSPEMGDDFGITVLKGPALREGETWKDAGQRLKVVEQTREFLLNSAKVRLATRQAQLCEMLGSPASPLSEMVATPTATSSEMESNHKRLADALTKLQDRFGDDALVKALEISAAIATILPAESNPRD